MAASVHAASLVDRAWHSPALLDLIEQPVTQPVLDHIVDTVVDTCCYARGRAQQAGKTMRQTNLSSITALVRNVVRRADVPMPVLLVTLAYLDRARQVLLRSDIPHLFIGSQEYAFERVFLGAVIAASKFTNDSCLRNVHWAVVSNMFGHRDVGRIEREFLAVLDFELGITESDVLAHHTWLSSAVPSLEASSPMALPQLILPHAGSSSPASPSFPEYCDALSPSASSDDSSPDMPVTPADAPMPSVAAAHLSALRVMLSPSYAAQHAEAAVPLKRKASRSVLHSFKRGFLGSSSRPQPEEGCAGCIG
ncbi:hypothetical protein PENSPDRAFT_591441 [Peniophora sp. CONT]|nr:hypothetical protein PENSPDRAFT_591441 [Peniophora sp. CONT]